MERLFFNMVNNNISKCVASRLTSLMLKISYLETITVDILSSVTCLKCLTHDVIRKSQPIKSRNTTVQKGEKIKKNILQIKDLSYV